jgi:hypothetical protein
MRWIFVYLFIINCLIAGAQIPASAGNNTDLLSDSGKIIIRKITFKGNKITKDRIIRRELLIKENDTISVEDISGLLQQSRKNLVNTSLFNFVTIDSIPLPGFPNQIDVTFEFIERWYIWPVPILEFADRNFNEWLKKKDLNRINYGLFLTWNNFRGRREKLIVYARLGYDEKYELSYQIPYINKKQTWGFGISAGSSQNHEIAYNSFKIDSLDIGSNITNKEVDFRSESHYPKRTYFVYAETYYRKGIHNMSWFKLGYNDLLLSDTILALNPDFSFGSSTRNQYLSLYYQFRSDYRDYKQYPLNGFYYDAELDQKGLGFFHEPDVKALSIKSTWRKYFRVKGRLYYAFGLTGKASPFWHQPYYYLKGMGYGRDFVRGYEYYVVDGQHFGLLKNNLKFELVPTRVKTFKFIPTDKFSKLYYAIYLNLYTDLGYVMDNRENNNIRNPLANDILVGYGLGVDVVTYYDFVIRFEYSFNKKGESGFFIHFMPSI